MYLLYRQNKITSATYKRFSNYVTNEIRSVKRTHFAQKFQKYRGDIRKTWKCINDVLGEVRSHGEDLKLLSGDDGLVLSDKKDIALSFNRYFSSIGGSIVSSIQPCEGSFSNYMRGNYLNS